MPNYNKVSKGIESKDKNVKPLDVVKTDDQKPEPPKTAVVANCNRLNVRDKPNKYGHAFHVLTVGDIVSVKDVQNGWAHITSGSNIEGYVMEEYLKEG